jgi:hypothetical protein
MSSSRVREWQSPCPIVRELGSTSCGTTMREVVDIRRQLSITALAAQGVGAPAPGLSRGKWGASTIDVARDRRADRARWSDLRREASSKWQRMANSVASRTMRCRRSGRRRPPLRVPRNQSTFGGPSARVMSRRKTCDEIAMFSPRASGTGHIRIEPPRQHVVFIDIVAPDQDDSYAVLPRGTRRTNERITQGD